MTTPVILPKPPGSVSPYPQRGLTCAVTLVALAAGCFVPLHLMGTLNLLFGYPTITGSVVVLASLAGMCMSMLLLVRIGIIEGPARRPPRDASTSRAVKFVLALTGLPYAAFLLDSLWSFPNGYDPLAYHINIALKWLQDGTMRVNTIWGWPYGLPSNGELPALVALSVGMPKAVAIGNLLSAVLLAASVYIIAWRMTHETAPSLLTAVVAVTIPIVIYQAFELYVDLFGTAFLVAAVALLMCREKRPSVFSFLSGYAAGIAIGSKPVFWIYGAMFAACALATVLRASRQRLRSMVLLAVGLILPSGFWFLRSVVATGNPVYPMRVSVGRHEIFHGYVRADITSDDYGIRSFRQVLTQPWSEAIVHGDGVEADRGTGPLFAAIAVPGVFFLLVRAARRRATTLEGVLLSATASAFVLWDVTLLRVPRFALPIMVLCCALAAPMLQALLKQNLRILILLFLLGVSLNSLYCLAQPAERALHRIQRHDFSRATYYGYPPLIDHLPPGSRIIDRTGGHTSFVLAGTALSNYVLTQGLPLQAPGLPVIPIDLRGADYVAKAGPLDADDAILRSIGATQIFDGTPPNLWPKSARPWRIYRLR